MKESILFTKNEYLILKLFIALTSFVTVTSVSSKFINGYNSAIEEKFSKLEINANNSMSFWISDCYSFFPHELFFIFFLIFTFLFLLAARKFINAGFLTIITFATFTLTLLQATYLSVWFAELANIEWNSALIRPNIFDGVLYFCFAIIFLIQVKIIYRFAKEKFQAKISLK